MALERPLLTLEPGPLDTGCLPAMGLLAMELQLAMALPLRLMVNLLELHTIIQHLLVIKY